jgi:hypothetical protein
VLKRLLYQYQPRRPLLQSQAVSSVLQESSPRQQSGRRISVEDDHARRRAKCVVQARCLTANATLLTTVLSIQHGTPDYP